MNVLVDARPLTDLASGGVRRMATGLVPALCAAFPKNHFYLATTGTKSVPLPFALPSNATRLHKHIPNKLVSLSVISGLYSFDRFFPEAKADKLLLLNLGFIGRTHLPFALVVHDLSFLIEPRWFSRKARAWHHAVQAAWLVESAKYLFTISEQTKRDIKHLFPPVLDRTHVIPMGLEPLAAPLPLPTQTKPFILAFGGNDPRKNSACAKVTAEALGIELITVGGTYRPDDQELAGLLKQATAFLYPSWYEGFGLPLHEAAQCGTPCIASTAGALPDTAPSGTLFADPSKPQQWIEALNQIFKYPEKHKTRSLLKTWNELSPELYKKFADFLD